MDEFGLIENFFRKPAARKRGEAVDLGIGDDAAILNIPSNNKIVVSADTLVSGVHFPAKANPALIAKRALRVNLSDQAAMGATPQAVTLSLTLPELNEHWLEQFSSGLFEDLNLFNCDLVGGDTTKGPLNIAIQVIGTIPSTAKVIRRSGAKPGDLVMITGGLGTAGAALDRGVHQLEQLDADNRMDSFELSYWLPEPRLEFAKAVREYVSAGCDISDGLVADLSHICEESGVGATIIEDRVPRGQDYQHTQSITLEQALYAGDDYELCLTVPGANVRALEETAKKFDIPLTFIGLISKGEVVSLAETNSDVENDLRAGGEDKLNSFHDKKIGYRHF